LCYCVIVGNFYAGAHLIFMKLLLVLYREISRLELVSRSRWFTIGWFSRFLIVYDYSWLYHRVIYTRRNYHHHQSSDRIRLRRKPSSFIFSRKCLEIMFEI